MSILFLRFEKLTPTSGEWFSRFMGFATQHMPSPADNEDDVSVSPPTVPTILRAATRLFSDVKVLTKDVEDFTVAIDIEGVLHNRKPLPDTKIDVIFLVDNGYVLILWSPPLIVGTNNM